MKEKERIIKRIKIMMIMRIIKNKNNDDNYERVWGNEHEKGNANKDKNENESKNKNNNNYETKQ